MSSYLFSKNRAFYSWFAEMMQEGLSITCEKTRKNSAPASEMEKALFFDLMHRSHYDPVLPQCSRIWNTLIFHGGEFRDARQHGGPAVWRIKPRGGAGSVADRQHG